MGIKSGNNNTVQDSTTNNGDIVMGDKISNTVLAPKASEYILRLNQQFTDEKKNNPSFCDIVDELTHYKNKKGQDVLGLEEKLSNSIIHFLLDYATSAKEDFTKKLLDLEYSPSAQKIFIYLLSHTESKFNKFITYAISQKKDYEQIAILINNQINDSITKELGENVLDLTPKQIDGILYFLTGNCHIKWT